MVELPRFKEVAQGSGVLIKQFLEVLLAIPKKTGEGNLFQVEPKTKCYGSFDKSKGKIKIYFNFEHFYKCLDC